MKVIKNYGVVACHGSKELRLQIIKEGQEKRLALVSYKDSMPMNVTDITAEAKTLKELLVQYLGIIPQPEPMRDIIKTLTSLPAGDINYQTELRKATEEDLREAIEVMKNSDGKHATRIKMCENMLTKFAPKESATVVEFSKKVKSKALGGIHKTPPKVEETTNETPDEEAPQKPERKYEYPSDEDKPKHYPLKTDGARTYEECVERINEERKTFVDSNSEYVLNGLLELAKVDQDFRNNLMREDKSFGDFIEYMSNAAMHGYCIKYGHCSWLDMDLSLGLAIDYYNNDDEAQKAEEKRIAEEKRKQREAEAQKKKGAKANGKKVGKKSRGTTA